MVLLTCLNPLDAKIRLISYCFVPGRRSRAVSSSHCVVLLTCLDRLDGKIRLISCRIDLSLFSKDASDQLVAAIVWSFSLD